MPRLLLLLLLLLALLLPLSAVADEWKVVSVTAKPFGKDDDQSHADKDFWLTIELRNVTDRTLYVPGVEGYYHIESFIRRPDTGIWERQNSGVDQNLKMVAIKPGETITRGSREFRKDIGAALMLTFHRALSDGDDRGSIILLDPLKIPDPGPPLPAVPKNPATK